MNIILRHVLTSIWFTLIWTFILLGLTFLFFPLEDWSLLLEQRLGNVSFLVWLLGSIAVMGIIVGLTLGMYWKQRITHVERKLNELVKGQNLSIDDESYNELEGILHRIHEIQDKLNKQTELSQRLATERAEEREISLQEVVEQERNRLARELHDSVSQQLFAASMMMSAINESNYQENSTMNKQLQMVEKMIQQSQLEMRALLLHLRPIALKGKSLKKGIEELLIELTQKVPMEINQKIEDFTIDKGVEDQLFRILQESLSNTLRHSKATAVHVLLIERDKNIILRVHDNGVGFDMENMKTGSYGLQNMRERAYEIGGTFKIISLPKEGTQLEVKVPNFTKER
ncbi:sensor histidine kinase [Oceanobacillus senegalensis]|uniref:sensor histidine kinase n=1 Tax=Oceanobacillus senegalensis TaxID=1936063 RepID=UPI000A306442|nr:sensor histidine kinase [Oceanobacillus senegalensis]